MDQNSDETRAPIAGALMPAPANPTETSSAPVRIRNLQGLLRFAMEATRAEDAPNSSDFRPMDEERRKFLENAFKSITVNVVEILMDAIKVLTDVEKIKSIQLGDELPEDVETAFENILSYIDDLDVANDFYKIGGFAVFPVCYGSENEEVRCRASRVLAELCQNNPFCQARALESGLLNIILHMVTTERGQALAKCISAVSSASREFEPSCAELTAQGGCEALAAVLGSDDVSAKTKSAFFIAHLCGHYTPAREKFIEQNIVRIIAEQIEKGGDDATEHLLSILHALKDDQRVIQQCQDINLKKILEEHLKNTEEDTFLEQQEYCMELLKIIGNCPQAEIIQSEADR
ncbi:uncharacterized protein LOC125060260 [Pieris napi]|uniref:uncharacterized protein LOC125060260 n=1 Tax=Pieris napi TaxID=78633 RepID=UPI001FB8C32D|nr:uncharacterized protein LOC125060260 [Pieris napi]